MWEVALLSATEAYTAGRLRLVVVEVVRCSVKAAALPTKPVAVLVRLRGLMPSLGGR